MADDRVSRRVVYRGRVQGVGFRVTAARIARRFPVGGTVRNCADGTVELVAVGAATDVAAFLDQLHATMRAYIAGEETSAGPAEASADRFEIIA